MKFILSSIAMALLATIGVAQSESIPATWVQHTVIDTVDVPLELYYHLTEKVDFEQLTDSARQKGMPNVVDGEAIEGDFSAAGHSRWLILTMEKK